MNQYNASVFKNTEKFAKGLGRMFYIIDPKDAVYENIEDVPNFYVQVSKINPINSIIFLLCTSSHKHVQF